jgi:hypothetical protein
VARGVADESVAGEANADTTSRAEPDRSDEVSRLRLPTEEDSNWVSGDTLYAIFERTPRAAGPSPPESTRAAPILPDSAGAARILPDSVIAIPVPTDSAVAVPAEPDSTADPVLERLTVIGHARSLYAQVRDTAAANRPSRNYMIGSRIDIFFRDGEPERVEGTDAIGLYLEPLETPESQAPETGAVPAPQDTTGTGAREDTTSVRVREDTTQVSQPPDSSGGVPTRPRESGARSTASVTNSAARDGRRDPPARDSVQGKRSGTAASRASRMRSGPPLSRIFP